MVSRDTDEVRIAKSKSRDAIKLALDGKWQEAAQVNREITDAAPDDLDAWNRLGKALMELGETKGAAAAFEHALTINPQNTIARKNLERLSSGEAVSTGGARMSHKVFTGDSGKTAQVELMGVTLGKDRPNLAPGVAVELRIADGNLTVFSADGKLVGIVPPKLGRRLVIMMEAGNQYEGAVASATAQVVRVVLRESYQHPSMRSKVSFPASAVPAFSAPEPAARSTEEQEDADVQPLDLDFVPDDEEILEAAGVGVGSMIEDGLPEDSAFEELAEEAS